MVTATTLEAQIESIYGLYAALTATMPLNGESGLGGKLLFAGEMAGDGRNLLFAANIAGAASLAASADPTVQRQAMRDGVVDFLVNSLEEALRILKNEVRKRQTVSVAVAADPRLLAERMMDRGVLPDLLPPVSWAAAVDAGSREGFLADGALPIVESGGVAENGSFVSWSVDREFARWLPRLDGCVLGVLPNEDRVRRRWLRLAPRYLGRMAQKRHGVPLSAVELAEFRRQATELVSADVILEVG